MPFSYGLARDEARKLKKTQLFSLEIAYRARAAGTTEDKRKWIEKYIVHLFQWQVLKTIWARASCVSRLSMDNIVPWLRYLLQRRRKEISSTAGIVVSGIADWQ